MPLRFLIAPDKFKGSLSAIEAANAIAVGIRRREPDAVFDLCPISDGGEGFMETLAATLGGRWIACPAVDALGRSIESRYLLVDLADGLTAFMEMSETAGLGRLSAEERDPLLTTTRGVGMQIAHAVSMHGVSRIVMGIGGSATNDGGCGMAAALGIKFLDADDQTIEPVPANLMNLWRIDRSNCLALPAITAACDVDNPLLGGRGATAVFSKQKGATVESMNSLEAALARLVAVTGADDAAMMPGAGAAGGLGFGLMHFAGARLVAGFDLLAGVLNLESRIRAADHVVTGEGSIDCQSLSGKGPVALAKLARSLSVPVTGFCGTADEEARDSGIFHSLHALTDSGIPLETLIANAASLLTEMVASTEIPDP
jgi:glycerate kinase